MMDYALNLIDVLFSDFIDPKKRIFFGYWLSAFVVVGLLAGWQQKSMKAWVFKKDIWWSQSAKADYKLMLINKLLMPWLGKGLISQAVVTYFVFESIHSVVGLKPSYLALLASWSDAQIALSFTFALFVLGDFSRFFTHWCLHKVPFLWAFHQVHHSARVLTPITVLRTHPVEGLVFGLRSIVVQSVCIGGFYYLFGDRIELTTVLGASIFVFAFNVLGANLRHSHVPLRYFKWAEKWFVSPLMHQLHHSNNPAHFDKNMGAVLSIWDRLFSTFVTSHSIDHHLDAPLAFGVAKKEKPNEHTLATLYLMPFVQSIKALINSLTAFSNAVFRLGSTRASKLDTPCEQKKTQAECLSTTVEKKDEF